MSAEQRAAARTRLVAISGPAHVGSVSVGPVDVGPVDVGPVPVGPVHVRPVPVGRVDVSPVDVALGTSSGEVGSMPVPHHADDPVSRAARQAAIARAAEPSRWEGGGSGSDAVGASAVDHGDDDWNDAGGSGRWGGSSRWDDAGGSSRWDDAGGSGHGDPAVGSGRWRRRVAGAVRDRVPPTVQAARWSLDPRAAVVVCLVAALAVTVAVLLMGRSPRTESIVTPTFDVTAAPSVAGAAGSVSPSGPSAPTSATAGVLVVDVAGFVARPGVYELPTGARVIDAVDAAGGAIEGTDLSQLNLARLLVDGEQVAVGVPAAPAAVPGSSTGDPVGGGGAGAAGPVDLNLATEADLDALPGVGPVLAARIVAWRVEHGRFSSVEELLEVSGIGDATLADIAPLVTV